MNYTDTKLTMLNKDQIKDEWRESTLSIGLDKELRKEIADFFSAQYEKLIEECMGEEISGDIPTSLDIPDDILHKMQNDMKHFREGFNSALSRIRTSLQERGIKIK